MEVPASFENYSTSLLHIITEISAVTFIALAVFLLLFILGLRSGKHYIVAVIFSLYLGFLAYVYFPYTPKLISLAGEGLRTYVPLLIFGLFTLLSFIILRNLVVYDYIEGGGRWFETTALSLAATLLLAAIVFTTFSMSNMVLVTPSITAWLSERALFFWWLVIPLVVVFLVSRK